LHIEKYQEFLAIRRKIIADAINSFLEDLKGRSVEAEINYENVIIEGENDFTEFKSSLRWDYKLGNVNKILEYVIAKTISAFMNSEGGRLFIGVSDNREMLGLTNDYQTLLNKNRDGFLLQLTQVINQYLGKEFNQYITIKIVDIQSKDVCVVDVVSSAMPVYIKNSDKEEFYIRASASSQPMSIREANDYIKTHWEN